MEWVSHLPWIIPFQGEVLHVVDDRSPPRESLPPFPVPGWQDSFCQKEFARRVAAREPRDLCSGPAKLTQAFGIDRGQDGLDLRASGELFIERRRGRVVVVRTSRIGVDYAGAWAKRRLRFLVKGNTHVSRPP